MLDLIVNEDQQFKIMFYNKNIVALTLIVTISKETCLHHQPANIVYGIGRGLEAVMCMLVDTRLHHQIVKIKQQRDAEDCYQLDLAPCS